MVNATGAQIIITIKGEIDNHINPDPDSTAMRHQYKEYTNFSIHIHEVVSCSGQNIPATQGSPLTFRMQETGDGLGPTWVKLVVPQQTKDGSADFKYLVNKFGFAIIQESSVVCGSQVFDSQPMVVMECKYEFNTPPGKRVDELIGNYSTEMALINAAQHQQVFLVPLQHWFCDVFTGEGLLEPYGSSYPLGASLGASTRIQLRFNSATSCTVNRGDNASNAPTNAETVSSVTLLATYILLDEVESNFMRDEPHKYLISENMVDTKTLSAGTANEKFDNLDFNFPTEGFVWFKLSDYAINGTNYAPVGNVGLKDKFNYTADDDLNNPGESLTSPNFIVNSNQLWDSTVVPAMYFRQAMVSMACKNNPNRSMYLYAAGGMPQFSAQTFCSFNLSEVERIKFSFSHTSGTTGTMYLVTFCKNVLMFNNLQPIRPYVG